jgi:2-polyprenyl-3-methyl-5-hydroxy-6-metoxy-1,4-benzoquinol methylase
MGSAQMQGDLWGARARTWADLQEGSFRPLYETAFTAAKVGQDSCVLDVGCGAGLACQVAMSRGAKVSGLDAASALVDIARGLTRFGSAAVASVETKPLR